MCNVIGSIKIEFVLSTSCKVQSTIGVVGNTSRNVVLGFAEYDILDTQKHYICLKSFYFKGLFPDDRVMLCNDAVLLLNYSHRYSGFDVEWCYKISGAHFKNTVVDGVSLTCTVTSSDLFQYIMSLCRERKFGTHKFMVSYKTSR